VNAPYPALAPTRQAALQQLAAFVPAAGRGYSAKRNYDFGAGQHKFVSGLSPYIRHRLLSEQEVVAAVLEVHTAAAAEKYIQEVCWRTYWKGWLEQQPQVWADYLAALDDERSTLRDDDAKAAGLAAAERGETGIACFDAWAHELVSTGYLHNHARMWFASIWIFTLRLPWALGADFFYRHLLDGDPASNTLSWRWVGGLHTRGKTYLARADNISTYTDGRFNPNHNDLAPFAEPLNDARDYEREPLAKPEAIPDNARVVLLLTEDDLTPEAWPLGSAEVAGVALFKPEDTGPRLSPLVRTFKSAAMDDAGARAVLHWDKPLQDITTVGGLKAFTRAAGAAAVVTTRVPVGYTQSELSAWIVGDQLSRVPILQIQRRWDQLFWPHAKAGFFQLKERIPAVLAKLNIPDGSAL
jgi:deoxyribodipyrimidine photo-lyase